MVSIAATLKENIIVGMRSMPGNPYDGHTLEEAIEPAIGHMKMDGRLDRNPLKGALGDALHACAMRGRSQHSPAAQEAAASLGPNLATDSGASISTVPGVTACLMKIQGYSAGTY